MRTQLSVARGIVAGAQLCSRGSIRGDTLLRNCPRCPTCWGTITAMSAMHYMQNHLHILGAHNITVATASWLHTQKATLPCEAHSHAKLAIPRNLLSMRCFALFLKWRLQFNRNSPLNIGFWWYSGPRKCASRAKAVFLETLNICMCCFSARNSFAYHMVLQCVSRAAIRTPYDFKSGDINWDLSKWMERYLAPFC